MKNLEKICTTFIRRAVFIISLFLGITSVKSQILINEISLSGNNGTPAMTTTINPKEDWVELYNKWSLPLSLSGYYLTDDPHNLYKWACPNITMAAGSYTAFYCDERNMTEVNGGNYTYHTNFKFLQCKSQWIILAKNGAVKDSFYVNRMKPGHSRGRYPDGVDAPFGFSKVKVFTAPSPAAANSSTWYYDYSPAPTFSTAPGYTTPANPYYEVWVYDTTNFAINYTIDGRAPCITYGGCPGTAPAPVTYSYTDYLTTPIAAPQGSTTVIRAISFPKPPPYGNLSGLFLESFIETNTYFEGQDQTGITPNFGVLSIVMDTAFFGNTAASAVSQTIHVEYFDNYNFWSEASGVINKPINDGWLNMQRGFDLTLIDEMGDGCAVQGQVFNVPQIGTSGRNFIDNFEVRAAGKDNFSLTTPTTATQPPPTGTHMRDAFVQSFANQIGLNLDYLHYKPVRCYFNGAYFGIYEFREVADWKYAKYYYGYGRDSSEILAEHAGGYIFNSTAQSDTGWVSTPMTGNSPNTGVFNYCISRAVNIAGKPYYPELMKRLDKMSFMDFFVYNSYLVNVDLFSLNNGWWRGLTADGSKGSKWHYFMWDMNNVLNLANSVSSIPTSTSNMAYSSMSVSPCIYTKTVSLGTTTINPYTLAPYNTPAAAFTAHNFMFFRLSQNFEFKNEYLNRYMDLLNTSLRCDKMVSHYNWFRYQLLAPEIVNHVVVWGVNQSDWESNMDSLLIRINERCSKIRSALTNSTQCYNLQGPFNITLDVKPADAGNIDYNSLHVSSFPWSGDYYQTKTTAAYLKTFMKAIPSDTSKYVFDHWEWTSLTNSTTATPDYKTQYTKYLNSDSLSFTILEGDKITAVFAEKGNDMVLPTGFTPNGDGNNDILYPLGASVRFSRNYEFQIWNRWGQEVYRTTDPNAGWDGKQGGAEVQNGVYAYMIKFRNVNNEDRIVKGNVTLIR